MSKPKTVEERHFYITLCIKESDLRKGLIRNMKDFIPEVGKDFTFIDEEYRVQVGGEDFVGTSEGLFVAAAINDQVEYEVKRLAKVSNVQACCMDLESFLQLLESRSCQK